MTLSSRLADALTIAPMGRLLGPVATRGFRSYERTGSTSHVAYAAMRKLYCADPERFAALERLVAATSELEALPDAPEGIVAGRVDEAAAALAVDGIYVLPAPLPAATWAPLVDVARRAPCVAIGGPSSGRLATFAERPEGAIRCDFREADLMAEDAVQRLVADESLLAVAQRHLHARPVQDLVAMWWNVPGAPQARAQAAQMFHFDLDHPRFLKLFIYLTDVDDRTGPHVFVPGSHVDLPPALRRDRRFTDDEVAAAPVRPPRSIVGPAGTAFLADTRALHKGEPVQEGERLVFQVEMASSGFGQRVDRLVPPVLSPALADAIGRHPEVFQRFVAPAPSRPKAAA